MTTDNLTSVPTLGDQPALATSSVFTINDSEEEISITVDEPSVAAIEPSLIETREGKSRLNPTEIKDILLELTYTVGS
jgi:hypothetical protein